MPKISVLMPVYNVEEYIKQSIKSVLNQKFKDFELIIVDDCGNDDSIKIAKKYAEKDDRIKIIHHKNNRGIAAARNTCLDNASGDYIMWLDPDDWYSPEALGTAYSAIKERKTTSLIYDGVRFFEDSKTFDNKSILENSEGYYTLNSGNIASGSDFLWAKIYLRDSIEKYNIRMSEECRTFEDGEFYFKYFALNPETYILEDKLYYYRRRDNSVVTNKDKGVIRMEDIYQVIKNVREFYKEHGIYEKYKKPLLELISNRINVCKSICNNYKRSLPLSKNILDEFGFPNEFKDIKKKSPYFSVIVPFYNVEKYIEQCLESIQGQTFSDIEIICVDDCGEDNSSKIVKRLAKEDKRIKIVKHSKNKGLGAARNTGMKYAKGEYVLFVDSDDWLNINMLQILYDKIQETNMDVISFKFNIWWESIQKMTDMVIFPDFMNLPEGYFEMNDEKLCIYPCYVWNRIYKRSFLIENNIYCPENLYFEDMEFNFKLYIHTKKYYVTDNNLYYYRRRDDSILGSSIFNPNVAERLFDAAENIYKFLVKNNLFEEYKNAFLHVVNTNINTWRGYPNVHKQLLPRMKKYIKNIGFPDKYTN